MVGMKVGETRDIQLVLPDDFEPAGLRGVDVTCTVRVTELFQYELAEVLLDSASMTFTCALFLNDWDGDSPLWGVPSTGDAAVAGC